MAIVPLKQTITVKRGGELDEWGKPLPDKTFDLDCRVDEGTFLIEYRTGSNITSREVTAKVRILLDKLADVRFDDVIFYKNELNQTIRGNPKKIDVKRHINGKPLLTEVYI